MPNIDSDIQINRGNRKQVRWNFSDSKFGDSIRIGFTSDGLLRIQGEYSIQIDPVGANCITISLKK